eukprot:GHVN01032623.1.p1 GENE.GHVN01032623.1~~GHVN01032623.1.p1  ORF type:complete len:101 (-),score=62.90 GHVN01032623.1:5-307(-)
MSKMSELSVMSEVSEVGEVSEASEVSEVSAVSQVSDMSEVSEVSEVDEGESDGRELGLFTYKKLNHKGTVKCSWCLRVIVFPLTFKLVSNLALVFTCSRR